MKKCTRSVKGKHCWCDRYVLIYGPPTEVIPDEWYKKCSYCGLVDDRKVCKAMYDKQT